MGYLGLNEMAKEMDTLIRETFPKQIAIETALPKEGGIVYGDRSEIPELLLNLCVNAGDAMMDRPAGNLTGEVLRKATSFTKRSLLKVEHPSAQLKRDIYSDS